MNLDMQASDVSNCSVDSRLWKCLTSLVSRNSRWIGSVAKEGDLSQLSPLSEAIIDTSHEDSKRCVSINSSYTKGLCKFLNGCYYEGELKNGKMEGEGLYRWTDGTEYEGEVVGNKIKGKGCYKWTDGSTYVGDVRSGYRNGVGTLHLGNGEYYEGGWVDGRMHGHGKMVFVSDEEGNPISYYEGEFVNNLRIGKGVRVYRTGNMYDGEWLDNLPHGHGRMHWRDRGEVYIGEWFQGVQSGYGEMYWETELVNSAQFPNKNHYSGEWKNGRRNGKGRLSYANGGEYWGEWVDDRKEGRGVYRQPNGDSVEGEFLDDKLLRPTERPESRALTPVSQLVGDVDEGEDSSGARSEAFRRSLLHLIPDKLDLTVELTAVHHVLLSSIGELKWLYHFYSRLGTAAPAHPAFTRLKLWQVLIDCQLFYRETFCALDQLLVPALPAKHSAELLHDPSVPLLLREFLQSLAVLGFHLFGSLYGGDPGRLAWSVKYLIEETLLLNACKGTGYLYQAPDMFQVSEKYFAPCFKLYSSVSGGKGTISYRAFLLMLRDCHMLDLVPIEVAMGLMTGSNPSILQEDCYRLMIQMNFLEFFNILLDCAKLKDSEQLEREDLSKRAGELDPLSGSGSSEENFEKKEGEEDSASSSTSSISTQSKSDEDKESGVESCDLSTDQQILSQAQIRREDRQVGEETEERGNLTEAPECNDPPRAMSLDSPREMEIIRWREQLKHFFDEKLFPEAELALRPPLYLPFSLS